MVYLVLCRNDPYDTFVAVDDRQSVRGILMVESWIFAPIIFVIGVIFAAGSFHQKVRTMDENIKSFKENDIKSIKDDIQSVKDDIEKMGESKSEHDKLIKSQQAAFSSFLEAFASVIATISKSNSKISDDLIKIQSKLTSDAINKTLQAIAGGTGNPVSAEEASKLKVYVERARINEIFTPQEAQDFYNLSQRVSQDRSDDKGAWGILLLAAFVFALYYLSKRK